MIDLGTCEQIQKEINKYIWDLLDNPVRYNVKLSTLSHRTIRLTYCEHTIYSDIIERQNNESIEDMKNRYLNIFFKEAMKCNTIATLTERCNKEGGTQK